MADAHRSEVVKDNSFQFRKFKGLASQLLKVSKEDLKEVTIDKRRDGNEGKVVRKDDAET